MHKLAVLGSALFFAVLAGCEEPEQPICDASIAYSVYLNLEDVDQDPVEGAEVVYTADDGVERPCDEVGDGSYVCGEEVAGDLTVYARVGEAEVSEDLTIDRGRCHVDSQSLTLVI